MKMLKKIEVEKKNMQKKDEENDKSRRKMTNKIENEDDGNER